MKIKIKFKNIIILIGVFLVLLANFFVGITQNIARAEGEIQITTWAELNAIRNNLSGDYILMNDLDETTDGYTTYASSTANEGAGWEPIGTVGVDAQFAGLFDGGNHTISGLYIDRPATDFVGLLGFNNSADISNIILEDVDIVGHGYVGALVGYNINSSISDSSSSGDITGTENYAGGLVGGNNGGSISNSYSIGSVSGNDYVGGLGGVMNNNGSALESYSTCSVSGDYYAGGLVGKSDNSSISDSYFTGSVSASDDYVGGLVGYSINNSIYNSYSTGSVSASDRVGGLVGHSDNNTSISNSYSTGAVSGAWYVGGLVGLNYGPISKSYSAGSVFASVNYAGGLVAYNFGSINYSFWDIDISGQETSDGGTGKTTAEMKTLATFTTELGGNSWDFADTWEMSSLRNDGYAYLQSIPPEATAHIITYTAGDNGSITGDSTQTVNDGENGTAVTAVPDEGYVFVNWSDDSTDNPRTDLDVTADIAVTANFAIDEVEEEEEEEEEEREEEITPEGILPEPERAKITSWSAFKYTNPNKSCSERLKITIKGKHFDDDAKVYIGGKEASSVDVKNSKKLTAKFCLTKLTNNKTDKIRIVSVKNPSTKERKADKKIDLNNLSFENENEKREVSDDYYNQKTQEGARHIQEALNKLGYLDAENITGTYGSITTEAVKKFQVDNGIESTGFVGPLTKAKFAEKVR